MKQAERGGLDRQEVVRVALQLLDEVGLDGLTMRSLADRLGVKAASLYWHLRDKEELAELLLEAINAELPDPDPNRPWREQLEQLGWAWRQVLLRHRDAARLAMGRFVARPVTLGKIEQVLGILRRAGFNDTDAANAAYMFSNYVPGFVAEEATERRIPGGHSEPVGVAPLRLEQARLEVGWASRLTISADPTIPDLYATSGTGPAPEIHAAEGVVNLFKAGGRKLTTIALNATVPWAIRFRHGASHLTADLRGLDLRELTIEGGTSAVDLILPAPTATVPIQLRSGVSKLTVHRPAEVPVRVEARGGISRLTFDHQPFKSAGELTVQSPGYDQVEDRYQVTLTGGASRIDVDTAIPPEAASGPMAHSDAGGMSSLGDLPAAQYPNLTALSGAMMQTSMDERFRFGMKVLLDGLERQR